MQGTLHDVLAANTTVQLRYSLGAVPESWVLTEDKVPESTLHDQVAQRIKLLLEAWAARTSRSVRIARNLAVRWLEPNPRIGIDPDVCVLEPAPEGRDITSLRLWQPGHVAPPLCFEIVSANHPHKDYREIQDRYAAMGTGELIVFDPLLVGPKALGGPALLQKWHRRDGVFEREAFGNEPVYSAVLGACHSPPTSASSRSTSHQTQAAPPRISATPVSPPTHPSGPAGGSGVGLRPPGRALSTFRRARAARLRAGATFRWTGFRATT
jgi:hypothetical protein